jgi:aspartyl-tRNA(Asn)/glutamyl-tRNA(Gln) amidotransferase subunit C
MAQLSRDDVLGLAKLAKLDLTQEEIAKFQTELSEILGYVEKLSEVDVSGLEPTTQVTGLTNVMRKDEVRNYGLTQQELLKNVPSKQGSDIKVRRVL